MSDLPSGWAIADVASVTSRLTDGSHMPPARQPSGVPLLSAKDVGDGALSISTSRYVTSDYFESEVNRTGLAAGDVLLTIVGSIGRSAVVPADPRFAFQRSVALLKPYAVSPKFLSYYLRSPEAARYYAQHARGTAQMGLYLRYLNRLPVPVPPRAEQERIVAAIEEQFSRLDAGVAALERVRRNLKRMRAAVLQAAVVESLSLTQQRITPLAQLLSAPLANGRSVPDGPEDGFPVLRLTAVRDGSIDTTYAKRGAWTADEAKPHIIRRGDYLVVRGNGSKHLVGRGGMVRTDSEVAYPDTLIRLRFDQAAVLPGFAAMMWESGLVRQQIERVARTTAGIYKVNQKDLGQITLPVPPLAEQARIESAVDGALREVAMLTTTLMEQLLRSVALRSAILAAAFSGRLVPQDPNDELASDLVERIAAERAAPIGHKPARVPKRGTTRQKVTA